MNAVKMNVSTASGLAALLIAFAAPAFAADPISYVEFIGTATKVSQTSASDITNVAKWGDGATPLSPESDYRLSGGKYCGFGGDGTFPGRSLTIGVVGGTQGRLEVYKDYGGTAGTFDFGTLILNKGYIDNKLPSSTMVINAIATVNASSSSPFYINMVGASGSKMNFTGSISGSGYLQAYQSEQAKEYSTVRIMSDMTGFTGTIIIGPNNVAQTVRRSSLVYFGDTAIKGTINVNPCGVIGPCGAEDNIGEFSVKNLSFSDGSTIRFGVNTTTGGTIRVTNSLTLPASGKVTLDVMALPDNTLTRADRRFPILIAPAGSELSEGKFELAAIKTTQPAEILGKLDACSLFVEKTAESETLYLVMDKYTVHNGTSDGWNESSLKPDYTSHWSGMTAGTPIFPDAVYVSYKTQMVSPDSSTYPAFTGKRLTLSGREFLMAHREYAITNFVIMNGAQVRSWNQSSMRFYGNLLLTNASSGVSATFKSASDYSVTLAMSIFGPGGIKLMGSNERTASDKAACTFYMTGLNTNLAGRVYLTNIHNSPETNTTLRISDVRQLGGPMESFTYNALSLSNWSRFRADATLDFNEPTRGVYFVGGNYVNVPTVANTLTLSTQTTLAGTLVKEGAGTLALGGTLKFTSAQSDTPVAGTNILRVAAGRIRPASKTGADGLAISFAAGTGLRLAPLSETDADVVRYGLYDVKWATPFDLSETDGKLNVALDLPSDRQEIPAAFSFGVCTVSATAAADIDENSDIVLPSVRGYSLEVCAVPNGDDTVTFTAKYSKRGFTLIVE